MIHVTLLLARLVMVSGVCLCRL